MTLQEIQDAVNQQLAPLDGMMKSANDAVWLAPTQWKFSILVLLLVGGGILFTLMNGGVQLRTFWHAVDVTRGRYDNPEDEGQLTHFQALSAALSATIGLGNIAGVAIAVVTGGPGAVFWMWVAGFLGMATKFTCCTLAVMHREVRQDGTIGGGPMYYMEQGLGKSWRPIAAFYAVFTICGSFGGGNMFQSNQAAAVVRDLTGISPIASGTIMLLAVGVVIIGGIRRIGQVASKIVPFMCVLYVAGGLVTLLIHWQAIPAMFVQIFQEAFNPAAALGGFWGVMAIGIRRAVFSNEAGLGSAAFAHSAARTDEPIREGLVAMLGPFIDTIVVCTMTALVILISGEHLNPDTEAVANTIVAFNSGINHFGTFIVGSGVVLFAYSTMISWSYYGEKGVEYLFGTRAVLPYRYVFVGLVFVGAVLKLGPVLDFSDASIGLMAFPNMVALLFLAPRVRVALGDYVRRLKAGEFKVYQ